ncbi:DUF6044 family protein [Paenibacillus harenae]|uniref:DUF6044 family protein n=1 Tax=Paenibacillus harenae TaxID=306543 RepID=UPI000404AA81|nr:DUF6044 family protein [Paenibacillus harenae]
MSLVKKSHAESLAIVFACSLIALYVSPLFILGEDAHIRVHDNLDSNIAWYRVLVRSGEWFGTLNAKVDQVINGLPRNAFGTEFSGIVLLHALFPSMLAYAISQTVTRIFAFIGMYLLLRTHLVKERDTWPIRVFVSLAFALTPFWPSGMLSTMGQPLALWAFLNIRAHRHTWREWVTLGLLPLYSNLVLGFFFFLVGVSVLWLRDFIIKRNFNPVFLGSIAFMTAVFLLVDYRLLSSLVLTGEPTSRNEFFNSYFNVKQSIKHTFQNFIHGHNHVATVHTKVILPLTLFVFGLIVVLRLRDRTARYFLQLLGINFALSAWYAFWFNKWWQPLKEQFSILTTFNFARFHFLRPLIIYVGFALACLILWKIHRFYKWIVIGALSLQLIVLFKANDEIVYRKLNSPTFRQFYAVEQFAAIRQAIGLPQGSYRIASIGLHPAVAQYNGFYTLDTYNNFYPLAYKHQFRKIIAKELDKNAFFKKYFDYWGGRCYIFADEVGHKYDYRKTSKKQVQHIELNTHVFKEMGGRYFFSAVPILNLEENGLKPVGIFDHEQSAWRIYVYEAL